MAAIIDVISQNRAVLMLGKSTVTPSPKGRPWIMYLLVAACTTTFTLWGIAKLNDYMVIKEAHERAATLAAAAAVEAKKREREQLIQTIEKQANRIQIELERDRKRLWATIANVESYRGKIPQVTRFLTEFPLPDEMRKVLSEPIDLTDAVAADKTEIELNGALEPLKLQARRAQLLEILAAARRYAVVTDRNIGYFNGNVRSMAVDDAFKAEFARKAVDPVLEPQALAPEPAPEVVVDDQAEPIAEPIAEPAKPAQAPRPQPARPKAVPLGGGRTQVLDW